MKKQQVTLRILVSPIVLILFIITSLYYSFRHFFWFCIYGGEWITLQKGDRKTIADIYEQLKSLTNTQQQ